MRRLRSALLRLAWLFGAGRGDAEIVEELQVHRDLLADEYVRSGMGPDEARRRAAVDFGSVAAAADAYQDRRGVPALEAAIRDGRMAVRSLARTPALSLSMVLVLGLGIGLSTAIAAVFHAIVWAALPVAAPEAVLRITQGFDGVIDRRVQGQLSRFSYPELETYRQSTRALVAVTGVSHARITWRHDTEMRTLQAAFVTGDYFRVLPVTPAIGRLLTPADALQPVVVISHRLWTVAFAAASDVIGRPMWLDRSAYTIVGVAPQSFSGTEVDGVGVWLPLEIAYTTRGNGLLLKERNVSWVQLLGRLARDASLTTAAAEAALIASQLDRDYPGRRTTIDLVRASRLDSGAVRQSTNRFKVATVAAVGAVIMGVLFLICGSNAAALLLARGAARQQEIAVRVALGADRLHIVRQLATEVGVIALAGAGVGVLVCFGALHVLAAVLPMDDVLLSIRPDARVFGFALTAALVVAVLFGLAPARQALQVDCLASLKGEVSVFGSRLPTLRLRRALLSIQVTVSVVLLVAAALLSRGVAQAWQSSPGYVTTGLYVVQPDANWEAGDRPADRGRLSTQVADALAGVPGIRAVAQATLAPFFGTGHSQAATGPGGPLEHVLFNQIDARYFGALGVPLVAGRSFLAGEHDAVMINAALARRFWTDERSALGGTLFIPARTGDDRSLRPMHVVGVAPTLQTTDVGILDGPTYYTLLTEQDARTSFLLVRAEDDVPVQRLVLSRVQAVHADDFALVTALDSRLLAKTAPARIGVGVAGLIGLLALAVAAVGIHGVIAYTVACRTREIGIHQALGARRAQVLRLVLGWTLRGVAIGAIGALLLMVAGAAAFGAQLRALLNGLNPFDPVSFLFGAVVLVSVIGVAAYWPARRALGMAPLAALRRD